MYSDKAIDKIAKQLHITLRIVNNKLMKFNQIFCLDFFLMFSFLKNKIGKALRSSKH